MYSMAGCHQTIFWQFQEFNPFIPDIENFELVHNIHVCLQVLNEQEFEEKNKLFQ